MPVSQDTSTIRTQWLKCSLSPAYFAVYYLWIYNATDKAWMPFRLWPAQASTLQTMHDESKLVILKARQLGLSWLALAYALWMMLFEPPATILLFSLKESEAVELLERLKGMYSRLPFWMQARKEVRNNENRWELSTGSRALAFSTQQGRSYTGSLAIVDEADFIPDLSRFLNGVKPTVDAGGKLFLISTSDKRRPVSPFKNLFRAAQKASLADPDPHRTSRTGTQRCKAEKRGVSASRREQAGAGQYVSIFLPWYVRPDRDAEWHRRTKAEMFAQRGTDDDFYAEYPATIEEALAPEQLDRRIPLHWLKPCIEDSGPWTDWTVDGRPWTMDGGPSAKLPSTVGAATRPPSIPGLTIYIAPIPGHYYVIGADPAEGNPHSDDSAATVMDADTWAEVACLVGKLEPTVFARQLAALARYYGPAGSPADILPERNNHGHALILALHEMGNVRVLNGYDNKPGWLSNVRGKPLLYDLCAHAIQDQACVVRSSETAAQLASIEAGTLRAPQGLHDDRADSFALCIAALAYHTPAAPSTVRPAQDPLAEIDASPGF